MIMRKGCLSAMISYKITSKVTPLFTDQLVSLGGHGVTCSPQDPRFVGTNPAEVDGFLRT